jgi:hypothetical protein
MRLRCWPLAVTAVAVAVSGCTSTPAASPTGPTARPATPSDATATATATAAPTAVPAGVTVVATGAAAGPTGTMVFVIVTNNSATSASVVQVNATADSSNGGAPLQATALIPDLAPGESQAAVLALTVPSGDSLGAISASAHATGRSSHYTNPLTASDARFIDDPISPSISVSVTGAASVSNAVIVAVCWTGSKIVGGGTIRHIAVAAGRARTVTMLAALTAAPSACSSYARPG